MKFSFFRRKFGKQKLSRDQIRIRVVFLIGVIGIIILLLTINPLWILAPQIPMLIPQDWTGSRIGTKLFFTDNWRMSPTDPYSPFLWEEKRGFSQSLYLSLNNVHNASVDQTVVWYADPAKNAGEWNRLEPDSFNGWPIIERNMESDKPASILACNPDLSSLPPQCWYLAYWEHWFTGVFFWKQSDEDSLLRDIHQLTARIDQLLMSAPDEPCFGFLCTTK